MEKYVTSIKDLIYNVMKNRIAEDDGATTNFQLGIVHLLGINTSVDFVRAGQFFSNSSLKNDPDANCLLGFVEECQGKYSSAFNTMPLLLKKQARNKSLHIFKKYAKEEIAYKNRSRSSICHWQ